MHTQGGASLDDTIAWAATKLEGFLTLAGFPVSGASAPQTAGVLRIGYLTAFPLQLEAEGLQVFEQTLRARGYVPGQNISIAYRSSDGHDERLPELASQLIQLNVSLLVTFGTLATEAAQRATSTIPIVMVTVLDPVHAGFVASLSHPGGNITGSSDLSEELVAKRVELLKQIMPNTSVLAVLLDNTVSTNALDLQRVEAAAGALGMKVRAAAAHDRRDIDRAFAEMKRWQPQALLVLTSSAAILHSAHILERAKENRLPVIYGSRAGALAGALFSYGPNFIDQYRHAAGFVEKILKGAKPADLPVEQPTRFELVVNLVTAKALGIDVPQSMLVRADEIIR